MTTEVPTIRFGSGLEIGYTTTLARFEGEVRLTAGTHYLLARNGRGKTTL
jgi:hypothetical protein